MKKFVLDVILDDIIYTFSETYVGSSVAYRKFLVFEDEDFIL